MKKITDGVFTLDKETKKLYLHCHAAEDVIFPSVIEEAKKEFGKKAGINPKEIKYVGFD